MTVYVPGLTDKAGGKDRQGCTPEMDREGYENRQRQRYTERMVRQWKRRQAVATTPEDERKAKAYVDRWQRKLRELTGETGLPRQYRREGGRVKLSEAAKRLGPVRLTGESISDRISQSPTFAVGTVSNRPYDPDSYKATLQERFDQGDAIAKALYERIVPAGGAVSDGSYDGVPEYRSETNDIHMSFAADAWNIAGVGTTWYHEHGHYIDAALGHPSHSSDFIKALIHDCRALEAKVKREHRLKSIEEARFQISANMVLQGVKTFGVQDIFGGVIGRPYPGAFVGHKEKEYWKKYGRDALGREAFAHMFEACFDDEKADALKHYLSTAWQEFRRILERAIE